MKYSNTDIIKYKCNHLKIDNNNYDPEMVMSSLRKRFDKSFWFGSNDIYQENGNVVIIAFQPIAGIEINTILSGHTFENDTCNKVTFDNQDELRLFVDGWMKDIEPHSDENCIYNGLFGYCSYNSVQLSENISFIKYDDADALEIPLLKYNLYQYILVFRSPSNEIILINNTTDDNTNNIEEMKSWFNIITSTTLQEFSIQEETLSDCTNQDFLEKVKLAKDHCKKGDVFQVVLSRLFSKLYNGDPWTFFLNLKSKDASKFQFFIEEGSFQICGTSPEIHFQAINGEGCINPIAGTYKRSSCKVEEDLLESKLLKDTKENSEHVMLVDLARNDLNKIATKVFVSQYKKIEKYAHVMHIVSRVNGTLPLNFSPFQSIMDVFPAGTLSGAPKYRAMQLIDDLENSSRSFYGGLIGWIGFNKNINTCIIIRSALFKDGKLFYRAGAGIVESSVPELELEEIENKLRSISTTLNFYKAKIAL